MALSLIFSVGALFFLIWSISASQFEMGPSKAMVIFDPNHITGTTENHAPIEERALLRELDQSSCHPSWYLIFSSVVWLLIGSVFGVITSFKFHYPDWLTNLPALTFGRLRPLHLNTVTYGWLSQSGMGIALWLIPRLTRRTLVGAHYSIIGTHLWNFAMVIGTVALFSGWTDGVEWLEYPWVTDGLFVIGGALVGIPVLLTIAQRRVHHLYVSVWYIGAAFVWFPFLFFISNLPVFYGAQHAMVNWWYAHNVLGLWLTPLGLAAAYYLIPKVLGRPIHSYYLSLIGFWSLALFYSQVGIHHLIGGPVPTWLVTLSVVTSVMMIIPVVAVAVNHHLTVGKRFWIMKRSPTLRFIIPGSMFYTIVSAQGSLMALRSVNQVTHFTHYTIAHAHLGVYGFYSLIMFGACYFALPRMLCKEWPSRWLVSLHFWSVLLGISIYVISLSIGGVRQGQAMLDPSVSFSETVRITKPYLWGRTVGGSLMTLGHFLFFFHILLLMNQQPVTTGENPRDG
jgi:cytochrome c oxidase cbb3-type subunit 1